MRQVIIDAHCRVRKLRQRWEGEREVDGERVLAVGAVLAAGQPISPLGEIGSLHASLSNFHDMIERDQHSWITRSLHIHFESNLPGR